jgi:hypothetical protein
MTPRPTLAELHKRIERLEAQQQWVNRVLEAYGIRGLWLSPAKAAPLLGVSRDRIMAEIDRAESLRKSQKPGDVLYGTHYRNIQEVDVKIPTWQVHVANLDAVLAIPPDCRSKLN